MMTRYLLLCILLPSTVFAQVNAPAPLPPAADSASHTIEENEHYRVQLLELSGTMRAVLPARATDTVIVALGEGLSLISAKDDSPLPNGDVRFVGRTEKVTIAHTGDLVSHAIVVDLKHHWDVEIQPCVELQKCSHPIRVGRMEVGTSRSLFTNGFVTAYLDRMDPGATLSTSYYSKNGSPHLMLIALSDLTANLGGPEQQLKAGQAVGSDAGEVEVDAAKTEAKWVVIRVETPKP